MALTFCVGAVVVNQLERNVEDCCYRTCSVAVQRLTVA